MRDINWQSVSASNERLHSLLSGRVSDRRLRLFACAFVRHLGPLVSDGPLSADESTVRALDVAERFAEGLATPHELDAAAMAADAACRAEIPRTRATTPAAPAAESLFDGESRRTRTRVVGPLTVLGRSVAHPNAESAAATTALIINAFSIETWDETGRVGTAFLGCILGPESPHEHPPDAAWRTWNGGVIPALARDAYEQCRMPAGTLDRTRLTMLADALDDADCPDAEMLAHLRGPGPHCRGCWAVDLVLGKA